MRGFAERGVLSGIMTFAEVVDTVAEQCQKRLQHAEMERSQVANHSMHGRGGVVGDHCDVPAGLRACLSELAYRCAVQRDI
jgi:hypothetical protein